MAVSIHFYRKQDDTCPVEAFLDSLSSKQAQKVAWVLMLIEELHRVPVAYFKQLENTQGIWEVRVQSSNNIFRLLGFFENDDLVILTHGFQKKSQKTPKREIALAQARRSDYLRRMNHE